jgi:hypothetical protein
MNFIFYLFIFINIFIFAQADIKKIESFEESIETLNQADKNSLVIFDIDNTLIMPEDCAFHDPSPIFDTINKHFPDQNDEEHIKRCKPVIECKQILIQDIIVQIIKDLQNRAVRTMALTNLSSLDSDIWDWKRLRYSQLNKLNINFNNSFEKKYIILENLVGDDDGHPIFYEGILATNRVNKGIVLVEFLKKIGWIPKRIIFFDDSLANILSVEEELRKLNPEIEFHGYHYIKADLIDFSIDKDIFNSQVNYLIKYSCWVSPLQMQSAFSYDEII